jgi:hypothetical protein
MDDGIDELRQIFVLSKKAAVYVVTDQGPNQNRHQISSMEAGEPSPRMSAGSFWHPTPR